MRIFRLALLPRPLANLTTLCTLAFGAQAQSTWHVDLSNPNVPGTGTLADPYTSIQFAMAQATTVDGDSVAVQPGVYFENVDYLGKDVRLRSTSGPSLTIIDAGGSGSVITVANGEPQSASLSGFTLRGGSGTFDAVNLESLGGGIYCLNSSLRVDDCILRDNETRPPGSTTVKGAGGAVYSFNAGFLFLLDCTIENNEANRGGGIWFEESHGLVFFSRLIGNTAVAADTNHAGWGGALGALNGNLNFDSCLVQDNEAEAGQFVPARGGGLLVWGGTGSVLNSIIENNRAGSTSLTQFVGQGGGVEVMFLAALSDMEVSGCQLRGNRALNGGGVFGSCRLFINSVYDNQAQAGGGVYSLGMEIDGCEIYANLALDPAAFASGIGVFTDPTATTQATDSQIHDNVGMGIGIGVYGGDYTQCQLKDNRAVGALLSQGGGAALANLTLCTLSGNEARQTGTPASFAEGGAMWSCTAQRCVVLNNTANRGGGAFGSTVDHCTFVGNVATNVASAGGVEGGGSLRNSIVWDNQPIDLINVLAEYSDIGSGTIGGLGNISQDPQFWQILLGYVALRPGSPCIDSGDPLAAPDFDGSITDMGAWTFDDDDYLPPFVYCTPKINSLGCAPNLFTTAFPSVSASSQFRVHADNVMNGRPGLLFWGRAPLDLPFQGGTLCVGGSLTRTPVQFSGGNTGTSDCSGSYAFHWKGSYIQNHGLQAGDRIFAQYWSRDPGDAFGTGLSAAVDFTLVP